MFQYLTIAGQRTLWYICLAHASFLLNSAFSSKAKRIVRVLGLPKNLPSLFPQVADSTRLEFRNYSATNTRFWASLR